MIRERGMDEIERKGRSRGRRREEGGGGRRAEGGGRRRKGDQK